MHKDSRFFQFVGEAGTGPAGAITGVAGADLTRNANIATNKT